mmetsp:Transcript_31000/g.47925  ORF Transcript_31000/g.47925 Transcript_31000/m.47925 type:complete len:221 (-) Transcript_31000:45-707(-)
MVRLLRTPPGVQTGSQRMGRHVQNRLGHRRGPGPVHQGPARGLDGRGLHGAGRHAPRVGRTAGPLRPVAGAPAELGGRKRGAHRRRRAPDDAQSGAGGVSGDRGRVHADRNSDQGQEHGQDRRFVAGILQEQDREGVHRAVSEPARERSDYQRLRYSLESARRKRDQLEELSHFLLEAVAPVRHISGTVRLPLLLLPQREHGRPALEFSRKMEGRARGIG